MHRTSCPPLQPPLPPPPVLHLALQQCWKVCGPCVHYNRLSMRTGRCFICHHVRSTYNTWNTVSHWWMFLRWINEWDRAFVFASCISSVWNALPSFFYLLLLIQGDSSGIFSPRKSPLKPQSWAKHPSSEFPVRPGHRPLLSLTAAPCIYLLYLLPTLDLEIVKTGTICYSSSCPQLLGKVSGT